MTIQWAVSVFAFAFVTCFTPGPNNTLLLSSGLSYGFRRTHAMILGISLGFAMMVLAVAFGISGVFIAFPQLYLVLSVISIVYLVWLAWRIASADIKPPTEDGAQPLTFLQAAAFQWVNPKAWFIALGASSTYVQTGHPVMSVVTIAVIFAIAGLSSSSSWAAGGASLRRLVDRPNVLRAINIGLALVLLASLIPTGLELWHGVAR